jgi:hypothetical protein
MSYVQAFSMTTAPATQERLRTLLWALLPAALTIYLLILIHRAAVTVPFADEQQFNVLYGYVVNGQMPPLTELMASHNGHPYLTLKLIMSAVFLLGFPWKVMMYVQPLLLAWCFYIAARSARLDLRKWPDALTYVALALAIITPRMWEDLYWGMQMSAQLCLALSLLAFAATARYIENERSKDLAIAFAAGCLAGLSAGAGILVPPMIVATIVASPARRNRAHLLATGMFLLISCGLIALSYELSTQPGIGHSSLNVRSAVLHAARMFAHLFYTFHERSPGAPWVGLFTLIVLCFVTARLIRQWPKYVFPLLSAALGCALIAMITYARVKAGLFQPNAPRYVPDILPLSIGLLLLLRSANYKTLLVMFSILTCLCYVKVAASEWSITPYRKIYVGKMRTQFCDEGIPQFTYVTAQQVKVMQTLYCKRKNEHQ